jgi:hypothetical protein
LLKKATNIDNGDNIDDGDNIDSRDSMYINGQKQLKYNEEKQKPMAAAGRK